MKGYITQLSIGNYGRWANALYQVCAVIGIARRNGLTPVFPLLQNKDHRDRFGSTEDIDMYKHFVNPLPAIPPGIKWIDKPWPWGYVDQALPAGNWNISGHFQCFKYFEHSADEVKWYMKMFDEKPIDVCAIHYRAGDYSSAPGAYHPRMPIEYYAKAFEHFPANQKYLIFSDDRDEAEVLIKQLGVKYDVAQGKDYIDDFRALKSCRHFIIANSTYGSLAAWFGNWPDKKVVSPSGYNWFGDVAQINGNDIPHESWIQVRFPKK